MALRCGFCDYFNGTDRSYDENNREVFYCSYHSCYVGRYEDACSHYSGQGAGGSGGCFFDFGVRGISRQARRLRGADRAEEF